MNYRSKTPSEKYPIYFNFSKDLASKESVASYTLTCVNKATGLDSSATIIDSDSLSSPEVQVVLKGGTEGDWHEITCVVLTSGGSTYQIDLLLEIATVVTDDFIKQPDDVFKFSVNFTRRLPSGDALSSAAITAIKESDGSSVAGTVVLTPSITGPFVGVPVAAGTDGETYRIGVKGTTVAGWTYEKTLRMVVQEF